MSSSTAYTWSSMFLDEIELEIEEPEDSAPVAVHGGLGAPEAAEGCAFHADLATPGESWDDITEVTADMLVEMPWDDEEKPTETFDALEPAELQRDGSGEWPRSFDDHLRSLRRAVNDPGARQALMMMGLGDIQGCEACAAAVAKAWEDIQFWQPMLELGRAGEFTGHLADLRRCASLLEEHPPPRRNTMLLARWESVRNEVLRFLPAARQDASPLGQAWKPVLISAGAPTGDDPSARWKQAMASTRRSIHVTVVNEP